MFWIGLFAFLLFVIIVVGDWIHFVSLSHSAIRYGCRIAKGEDHLSMPPKTVLSDQGDSNGLMSFQHGIARVYQDENRVLLRPHYRINTFRFPTAWPIKAAVQVEAHGEETRLTLSKLIPWSSALVTIIWFSLVGFGTLIFLVKFIIEGGMGTLAGALMGLGITGMGVLVLIFGLVMVSLAYRLENDRLMKTYQEFRDGLKPRSPS